MPNNPIIAASLRPGAGGPLTSAAVLIDGNAGTTLAFGTHGVSGAADDWVILDQGGSLAVYQVTLSNLTINAGQPSAGMQVYVGDVMGATPSLDASATLLGEVAPAPGGTVVITGSAALTGRYVFLLPVFADGGMTAGEVSVAPAPPIAVPSLSATPELPGNVPTILLQGE